MKVLLFVGPPRMLKDLPYIVNISSDTVSVAWRSAEIPSRIVDYAPVTYRIELQEMPYGQWITVAKGIPATSFRLENLHPNKDYGIRIRAENEFGLSEPTGALILKKRAGKSTFKDTFLFYYIKVTIISSDDVIKFTTWVQILAKAVCISLSSRHVDNIDYLDSVTIMSISHCFW